MQNYDELILRGRRIDSAAPFPVLHQAVRIAMYEEYAARSFHARVVEAFGPRPPFADVLRSQEQQVAALAALCERFGIPRPLDPFPQQTSVAPLWLANCERAMAGEAGKIRLYGYLLANVAEPEARRVLQDLQATAFERHLPAFRQAVSDAQAQESYHAARGIPPQQAYVRHGPVSDFLERALAQLGPHAGPLGLFSPLLRRAHPAMLAGMVAGGAGSYLLKNRIGRHRKEN
ncbi:ferritin-like domain-containing protein [Thauera sinica]|uniref:Ferritin n=1 Tax=Thauera sinica TaxID=2665146 RepID=A0ABW1AX72_9RHOO|nr:ferritin [Thauera sp. K11]ATE61089.1 ferritin [Thauera sp. K11]